MSSSIEAIKKRISVRTYAATPLDPDTRSRLEALCRQEITGPFGSPVRFKLLNFDALPQEELRSLGTYGVIKGARLYILSAVRDQKGAMEDLGFCLEKVILQATAMGLGTCWLAGTFRRSSFARHMDLEKDELLPAITPVGYAAKKASFRERLMRSGAKARIREPWENIFFRTTSNNPLTEAEAGPYRAVLDAVQQGPSATNRQPWRIVKQGGIYRLYLDEFSLYNWALGKTKVQYIDMGIAMCHFQLAAEELGLAGRWQLPDPPQRMGDLIHIADWMPGN